MHVWDFSGKRIVVTGAAGALGAVVASKFARAGARVALFDLAGDRLAAVARGLGEGHRSVGVDLLDRAAVAAAVQDTAAALGGIDVLCNIAGGFRMGPKVHETPEALWRQLLDLNATSLLNAVAAVVPVMLTQGQGGKIVNVGALAALGGKAQMGAYVAAKSAVIRLTESMGAELREHGINVNCVLPSIIDTPANRADMPKADPAKWVHPDALADVVAFLASDAARAVHGAAIPVAGLS